jgi:PEP-CTERM motif
MKLRSAVLLCVGVLLATAPAWADGVSCCEFAKASTIGFAADLEHGFQISNDTNFAQGLKSYAPEDAFFSFSSSREEISSRDFKDLAFYERFSDHTKPEKGWLDGNSQDRNPDSDDSGSTSVPEPGTLPLLLLGLTAVGVAVRRR